MFIEKQKQKTAAIFLATVVSDDVASFFNLATSNVYSMPSVSIRHRTWDPAIFGFVASISVFQAKEASAKFGTKPLKKKNPKNTVMAAGPTSLNTIQNPEHALRSFYTLQKHVKIASPTCKG